MIAEISFDLVMEESMEFVEGTYRLPNFDWQVFIFIPWEVKELKINTKARWESGVSGTTVHFPESEKINKTLVFKVLADALGVSEWKEVHGPDSMDLR
jgi:hypothetical protein